MFVCISQKGLLGLGRASFASSAYTWEMYFLLAWYHFRGIWTVPEDEDKAQEGCVAADSLEPVIVDVEEHHLWLCCLQDEIPKLLHLQRCLQMRERALRRAMRTAQ